jgi:predicted dehydrogenase
LKHNNGNNNNVIEVGIVGYGYWGPNLVRKFIADERCRVTIVCDRDPVRLRLARAHAPGAAATADYEAVLASSANIVALAVPPESHFALADAALAAGKHVLIEKPMCCNLGEADTLIRRARKVERHIFVDHTYVFTPAVRRMAQEVWNGNLGELLYYDSIRVNLGLFADGASVLWDLGPHDLSILDYVLHGQRPTTVSCIGDSHFGGLNANIAYLTLRYGRNFIAHVNLNWLAPVKVRQILLGGAQKMLVYDDTQALEKIRIYDKGVTVADPDPDKIRAALVQYRTGDMHAPFIKNDEALAIEVAHIAACLLDGQQPIAGHEMGRRVMEILRAADASMLQSGEPVPLASAAEPQPLSSVAGQ